MQDLKWPASAESKAALVKVLTFIGKGGGPLPNMHSSFGLCSHTLNVLETHYKVKSEWDQNYYTKQACINLLRVLMTQWPEYSGDPGYPVPYHGDRNAHAIIARAMQDRYPYSSPADYHGKTWAWVAHKMHDDLYAGPYGEARCRLALYVADRLNNMELA
jgi:hypothetical protein